MPFDTELEQFADKIEKSDKPMAKADLYSAMKKFANRQRTGTQSEQQAFVAFVERDPYGKQLFRQYNATKGVSVPIAKSGMQDGSDIDGPPDGDDKRSDGRRCKRSRTRFAQSIPGWAFPRVPPSRSQ
jgi:hypothetical protein